MLLARSTFFSRCNVAAPDGKPDLWCLLAETVRADSREQLELQHKLQQLVGHQIRPVDDCVCGLTERKWAYQSACLNAFVRAEDAHSLHCFLRSTRSFINKVLCYIDSACCAMRELCECSWRTPQLVLSNKGLSGLCLRTEPYCTPGTCLKIYNTPFHSTKHWHRAAPSTLRSLVDPPLSPLPQLFALLL
jgi:hypothetical protein